MTEKTPQNKQVKKMKRKIETEINLGKTVSPVNSISSSSAIDRTASNVLYANEKGKKLNHS